MWLVVTGDCLFAGAAVEGSNLIGSVPLSVTGVCKGLGECIGTKQAQPHRKTLFVACLQRMIVGVGIAAIDGRNAAIEWIRPQQIAVLHFWRA